jgi:two-component system LytT family response regulator
MKAIIIEDEPLLLESLKQKIERNFADEMEIVATCTNAEDALIEIMHRRPELIFLDIQLPEQDGLWLAERLMQLKDKDFTPPEIIFTTAFTYSEYLLKAFDLAAVSYLVKPIDVEELKKAVGRFKERVRNNADSGMQNLAAAIGTQKILKFKSYRGILFLRPENIVYIKADRNYAVLRLTDGAEQDVFESLGEIENNLPKDIFLRTGKSYIINRHYIRQLDIKTESVQLESACGTYNIEVSRSVLKGLRESL